MAYFPQEEEILLIHTHSRNRQWHSEYYLDAIIGLTVAFESLLALFAI